MGSKKKEEKLKEVRGVYRSGTTAVSARAASLSQAVDSLLKGFEKKGLLLRNPPQIRHYLMEFPRLVRLLPQIIESVRRHISRALLFVWNAIRIRKWMIAILLCIFASPDMRNPC